MTRKDSDFGAEPETTSFFRTEAPRFSIDSGGLAISAFLVVSLLAVAAVVVWLLVTLL